MTADPPDADEPRGPTPDKPEPDKPEPDKPEPDKPWRPQPGEDPRIRVPRAQTSSAVLLQLVEEDPRLVINLSRRLERELRSEGLVTEQLRSGLLIVIASSPSDMRVLVLVIRSWLQRRLARRIAVTFRSETYVVDFRSAESINELEDRFFRPR